MSDHQIQLGIFVVTLIGLITGLATLGILIWYAVETKRLRIAAQDQLEALAKPCLTLLTELRDPSDAILEMHQAIGNTIAAGNGGNFILHNIGNGVALNVTYSFHSFDPDLHADSSTRYFISVTPGQKVQMPEPMNVSGYSAECELVFTFDSIGGTTYQSKIMMNHHVLTRFNFKCLGTRRKG
jgi:hypothetical protein